MKIIEQTSDKLIAEGEMTILQRVMFIIFGILFGGVAIFLPPSLLYCVAEVWLHLRFDLLFHGLMMFIGFLACLGVVMLGVLGIKTCVIFDRAEKEVRIIKKGQLSKIFDRVVIVPFGEISDIVTVALKGNCFLAIRKKELTYLGFFKDISIWGIPERCSSFDSNACVQAILDFWKDC